jgi:hypothetical protein
VHDDRHAVSARRLSSDSRQRIAVHCDDRVNPSRTAATATTPEPHPASSRDPRSSTASSSMHARVVGCAPSRTRGRDRRNDSLVTGKLPRRPIRARRRARGGGTRATDPPSDVDRGHGHLGESRANGLLACAVGVCRQLDPTGAFDLRTLRADSSKCATDLASRRHLVATRRTRSLSEARSQAVEEPFVLAVGDAYASSPTWRRYPRAACAARR